jgi:formylglycine-generating enzyme required for sulfatase activity
MKKAMSVLTISTILLTTASAIAADKVVVVPLGGTIGDAVASDVVKGKTFSSKAAGKGVTGALELSPTSQSYSNSNNMTFNLIPAEPFTMGSPDDEPGGPYTDEQPQHQVTLSNSFYMQTTEVTQKQWQDIIGNNPALSNKGNEYPLETVNWFEAAWFANALSTAEGRSECYTLTGCSPIPAGNDLECTDVAMNSGCTGYRLPTEAEWEYAARATTTTAWSYLHSYDTSATGEERGTGFNSNLHAMGWYEFNNVGGDLSRAVAGYPSGTKPVARKQPNKWGLYDMPGNVLEWCQDWYDSNYYSDAASGIDPQGPDTGVDRVIRGGSWANSADGTRSANRFSSFPGLRNSGLGFRLVFPQVSESSQARPD